MSTFNGNDKIVLIAIGAVMAGALPYAYANDALLFGVVSGSILFAVSCVTAALFKGGTGSQVGLPVLGMAMVALLIHVARGHTVAHFAVFAFLSVTMVYRHWLPVVAAAGAIAVHHLSFNFFQQWGWGPICFTAPGFLQVVEHALYVVAEAAVLILMAVRASADHRAAEELTGIANGLQRSDGSISFAAARGQWTSPVTRQLAGVLASIEGSIAQVRSSAESINTASVEIATGNQDLSAAHRADRQQPAAGGLLHGAAHRHRQAERRLGPSGQPAGRLGR